MSTKIGFNNFKAFGPKMQYFTKKPLTLVYGPNSVGKSSLIRALLYREYLKTKRNFQEDIKWEKTDYEARNKQSFIDRILIKPIPAARIHYKNIQTNCFGDNYDIGNFESMIHKRDMSQTINYNILYNDRFDFHELIPFDEYLIGFLNVWSEKLGYAYLDTLKIFLTARHFKKNPKEVEKVYSETDDSKKYYEFMLSIEKLFLKQLSIDTQDLSKEKNIKTLEEFIDFTKLQLQIQSLQIKTSVNNELKQSHQFYVDGELLFECEELDFNVIRKYNIKLFTNNSAFAKVFFKPNSKQHVDSCLEFQNLPVLTSVTKIYTILGMRNINSLFDIADNYTEYLKFTLHVIISRALLENKSFKNIYLEPLRTIPARKDFTGNKLFFRRQRRKQKIINQKSFKCLDKIKPIRFLYSKKYLNFIYWMLWVPLYFYCMSNKIISTFYNSIFITNGIPKFINPNSKSYLHLWYSIVENGKVKKKINQWLKDKGKHNSSYTILSDNTHFSFFDESTQTAVHPQDMGVGISQSLPIIVASHLYKDTNIYIEQPELHLHPKLQMEIADEFIKSINENDNSFVIESHSEHLLLRIMKRMRHTAEDKVEDESLQLTPDDVCLLYVDNNGETTYIKELELDTDGTLLDPWPNGFFEEGHKERFE